MAFDIIVSPRAQKEIKEAIDYYAENSADAPSIFLDPLIVAYNRLKKNPLLCVRYKTVRAVRIKRFPYLLYFIVSQRFNTVRFLSCFHAMRNPISRPRFNS